MNCPRLAVALDDAPACPACELGEEHAHRTRRSPAPVPTICQDRSRR